MKKIIEIGIQLLLVLILVNPVFAQEDSTTEPIYIVQPGDTLWNIALRLHVSYDELLARNGISDVSSILPGTELVVPGLDDMTGELTTEPVSYGDTLQSLSRRYRVPESDMVKLNRLTSPFELYVGVSVVLIGEGEINDQIGKRVALAPQQTSLELAVEENLNPWTLLTANDQAGDWHLIPGEVLYVPGTNASGPGALPGEISSIDYSPNSFVQGHTYVMEVNAPEGTTINGALGEYPLNFFSSDSSTYLALQGLHAKESLGIKPISISGTLPDGTPFAHTQMIQVQSGNYPYEEILDVPMETVSVELSDEETSELLAVMSNATQNRFWEGVFSAPVPPQFSSAYASYYGNRRSFNGSGYFYFHSGLDFYSLMGGDILAPAPGKVVYTGLLPIRGNTTIVNHGWGVYTLFAHQSEYMVSEGQRVQAGDILGKVGSTGRSSGPHLHWEVWVGGVAVDPLDWIEVSYP